MSELALVWAQSRDGVIGRDGTLPWHLPEDLAHFRRLTTGAPVIMGRATWDSLPERFRPLPGRTNVVLSRRVRVLAGATVVDGLDAALAAARDAASATGAPTVWGIGGAAVLTDLLPLADRLEVTDVDVVVGEGTRAPVLPPGWDVAGQDPPDGGWHTSDGGLRYRFRTLRRAGR